MNDEVFFFFYIHWIIYFKFFQESCVGHADEKKKEKKEGTKRVRARITGRPGKLRHTPRCSGIHQVSPATTQSAKPLTIRILLLEKPLFDERPQNSWPYVLPLCESAKSFRCFVRSFVPDNSALSVAAMSRCFSDKLGRRG